MHSFVKSRQRNKHPSVPVAVLFFLVAARGPDETYRTGRLFPIIIAPLCSPTGTSRRRDRGRLAGR